MVLNCRALRRSKIASTFHWLAYLISATAFIAVLDESVHSSQSFDQGQLQESFAERGSNELFSAKDDHVARELFAQQRVLCWIMTGPANHERKAKAVKETWGKRCNILLFMSSESDETLPTVKLPIVEGREALWGKTKEAFRYIWAKYREQADWFMKADDDSYVIMENLRYLLTAFNTTEPIIFGHKSKHPKNVFMMGGAGYVLSKEALRRFMEQGIDDNKICRQDPGGLEDVELSGCMQRLGVKLVDSRDTYGRHRFFPANHWDVINAPPPHKDFWYWAQTFYPIKSGMDCCSDTMISFHYVSPNDLYIIEFLLYQVQPYGLYNYRHTVQRIPGPAPDANLTAPAHPGPSDEEERMYKEYQEKQKQIAQKAKEFWKKASELDKNKDLRMKAIARLKATSKP